MSKFNTKQVTETVTNLAGGQAHAMTPELELTTLVLTSFLKDNFYESSNDTVNRLKVLVQQVDVEYAAKLAVYARKTYGMRSITHVLAVEVAKKISGKPFGKAFYNAVINRPDDITEIVSYYKKTGNKSIPSAMKKGFSQALGRFDAYQLAKYRMANKDWKLVDVVNLIHAKPTEKNSEALKALVADTLRSTDTWESELSEAGNSENKEEAKKEAWGELISSRKIGYFALLRNLRNIIEQAPDQVPAACLLLQDEKLIKNSLVLPFRYLTALAEMEKIPGSLPRQAIVAINKAIDISINNVPKFSGETLVVIDHSGSMGDGINSHVGKGALFGAIVAKSNTADIMIFGDDAAYVQYNPADTTLTLTQKIIDTNNRTSPMVGHGTNFPSIFMRANKKYDRILIFSDMQGWVGYYTPKDAFNSYKTRLNANPHIYSIDLAGYGTLQFPENRVYTLAGFSEKIFDTMVLLETDKQALVNTIKATSF